MKQLFLATPSYPATATFTAHAAASFFALGQWSAQKGMDCRWDLTIGDANHARAWNTLFHRFLQSDAERLVGIDNDQVFRPEHVEALLDVQEDFVGGAYVKKRMPAEQLVGETLPNGEVRGRLLEMRRVGFGFFAVTRDCIARLSADAVERGEVFIGTPDGQEAGQIIPAICTQGLANGEWEEADWRFAARWRALGGQVWLHTGVNVGHIGVHVF